MHDRVLVNVESIAVGGRRAVPWPGVPRAGPAVPAPLNVLKYQSLLLFALCWLAVCLLPEARALSCRVSLAGALISARITSETLLQ